MLFQIETEHDEIIETRAVKAIKENYLIETEFLLSAIERLNVSLGLNAEDYFIKVGKQVKFDHLFLSEEKKDFYYKVTTKYEVEQDNGNMKVTKDVYLVEADSFRGAEELVVEKVIGDDDLYDTSIIKSEQLNLEGVILLEENTEYPQGVYTTF